MVKALERDELESIRDDIIYQVGLVSRFAEDDRNTIRTTDDTMKQAFAMGSAIAEEFAVEYLEKAIRRIEFVLSMRDITSANVTS